MHLTRVDVFREVHLSTPKHWSVHLGKAEAPGQAQHEEIWSGPPVPIMLRSDGYSSSSSGWIQPWGPCLQHRLRKLLGCKVFWAWMYDEYLNILSVLLIFIYYELVFLG